MKILIVTWYFPPSNTMGALRLGKMVKTLLGQGHEVSVLSARAVPRPQNLPMDLPGARLALTPWLDINAWPRAVAHFRRRWMRPTEARATSGPAPEPETHGPADRKWSFRSLPRCLGSLYMDLFNLPDQYVGWLPYAIKAGKAIIRQDRPDVIFASGPPFSGLIVGRQLAKHSGLPWVAELRDRWSDDPYYPPAAWRGALMRRLERWTLRSAAGLVTVSEPWMPPYQKAYGKPTIAVYNGYDPEDFPEPGAGTPGTPTLHIVHTGRIYPGRRDPSPLFEAIGRLADPTAVKVSFVGAADDEIKPLAERFGLAEIVEGCAHLPYQEALAAQGRADILLLMQWNDPQEQGNVPGKLFEYLATRRPILGLGLEDGVPAGIIRQVKAGFFSNDPELIAAQLTDWLQQKTDAGAIPALPPTVCEGFSRVDQFAKLETLLLGSLPPR